jgi:beta-N-acetylhexosaminidase
VEVDGVPPSAPASASNGIDAWLDRLTSRQLVGQLVVVGFAGTEVPAELGAAFEAGERAGVVVFRRNIEPGLEGFGGLQRMCASLAASSPAWLPPLVAIDEEGGRVARLGPPALRVPPMRQLAELGDLELIERVGAAVGRELAGLGVTMNFAPVVDVDTNPDNPIIGDRAFSREPEAVIECAAAYLRGLRAGGVAGCLKHYPGHGDTLLDSHLALPTVGHERARLEAVELLPFRRLAAQADSMMTAHVVYPALDPDHPATLSPVIASDLLRTELGFDGVLFSDDLEMQAIAGHGSAGASAVAAVRAGCDLLLVCSRADLQTEVCAALLEVAERDAEFALRCRAAARRGLALRHAFPPRPGTLEQFASLLATELDPLATELERRLASPPATQQ